MRFKTDGLISSSSSIPRGTHGALGKLLQLSGCRFVLFCYVFGFVILIISKNRGKIATYCLGWMSEFSKRKYIPDPQ